jgi:hypothetical protein
MPKAPAETLAEFLTRQDKTALVHVLIELSEADDAVRKRLARLQLADQPDKLAAAFKRTLAGWRRSRKFRSYGEARAYGQALRQWLDQIARELMPSHPPAALGLFEQFIESDAHWFENADDSDGSIGSAVRAACVLWLQAAARCESPRHEWPERIVRLYEADSYGAREELLRQAHQLLPPDQLQQLVAKYQQQMSDQVSGLQAAQGRQQPGYGVFKTSAALSLLSESLRDPDIRVRAVLAYSPAPNGLQRESFARAYLEVERPQDALRWLEQPWDSWNDSRMTLLAQALYKLGRVQESAALRKEAFEASLSSFDLEKWLGCLPAEQQANARIHALALAQSDSDAVRSAQLMLHLEEPSRAEERVLMAADTLDGTQYATLTPLAEALKTSGCHSAEAAVLRALLQGILDRANARAYGHAARYLLRLRELDHQAVNVTPLPSHAQFEAALKLKHGRKAAFWGLVGSGVAPA